jgi:serine/threonine protein kinase/Tol biopolymer transport system component
MPVEPDKEMAGPEETLVLRPRTIPTAAQAPHIEERSDAARQQEAGRCIGPYRLVELIGEGGMGEVWLAEQLEPVRRRVALKVIKAGMDTRQVVARFESERQALALMDHRAIAKVLDGGSTSEGRPYFVMEYVPGVSLIEHCDNQKLSTRARLELFSEVCDGVQHAHHKAVIHRDLKPSNILVALVEGKAQPKIIDFGIAKATGQRLTAKTLFTEAGALIGTPEYMSPEQADLNGQNVDTRTDVYSLGVILYQLLTGELPLGSKELLSSSLEEFRRTLREVEPPRPSTRVSTLGDRAVDAAQNRNTDPGALRWQVEGDLDAITMKALEKEPARRYGTPSELAADIGRQLRNEPVTARPPSQTYRLQKYVRRHRLGVAFVATLAVLLLAFAATMTIQARRLALSNAELLLALQKTRMPDAEQMTRDKLEKQRHLLGAEHRDTIVTMHVLANLLVSQGRIVEAEKLRQEALELERRVLGPDHPEALGTMVSFAFPGDAAKRLGAVEKLQRDTFETQRRELGPEHPDTLRALGNLAIVLIQEDRLAEAEKLQREVLETQQRVLGARHLDTLQSMSRLATTLFSVGRLGEAEKLQREAFETRRSVLGPGHPDTIRSMGELATTYSRAGSLAASEKLQRETLETQRRMLGPDDPKTASTKYDLASNLAKQGRREDALVLLRDALEHGLETRTARGIPQDPDFKSLHGEPGFEALLGQVQSSTSESVTNSQAPTQAHVPRRNGRIAWAQFVPFAGIGIFTGEPDGTDVRQLTFPEAGSFNDGQIDWSPDGSTIVFARGFDLADVVGQIYRMNADGTALTQIGDCTAGCAGNAFPRYSPDGSKIAFIKWIGPVKPDGTITAGGVWIMNADGTNPVQLTQQRLPTSSEDMVPSWSPDGKALVFGRVNTTADPVNRQAIFVAQLDGSDLHQVTQWELDARSANWSPDGKLIMFSSHEAPKRPGKTELYMVHPDGSGLVKVKPHGLTEHPTVTGGSTPNLRVVENARFSPDGKKIIFQHQPAADTAGDEYCCVLYQMNTDGSELVQVSLADVAVYDAAWGTHP